jgi:hypothetical protein
MLHIDLFDTQHAVENSTKPYWFLVTEANDKRIQELAINISGINFDKNNAVLSIGSSIESVYFNKKTYLPFINTHFVTVRFHDDFNTNIVYIYLTKKIQVYEDWRYINGSQP